MSNYLKIILIALLLQGCATQPLPKVPVSENAKIGVMFLTDQKPKHVHVGTTMFNNFENKDVSDWDLKPSTYRYIEEILNKHSVVLIEPSQELINNRFDFISTGWDSFYFNDDLKKELNAVILDKNIDFLITFEPYSYAVERNSTVSANGYGLFTRCLVGSCKASVLSNFAMRVYATNPPIFIGGTIASIEKIPVEITIPSDMENVSTDDIDKAKSLLMQSLHNNIINALHKLNFI